MADLLDIAGRLPPQAQHELLDFAEFLENKYRQNNWPEANDWKAMSQASLAKVWDNPEDDGYAELL